jgi:hypothetical protein
MVKDASVSDVLLQHAQRDLVLLFFDRGKIAGRICALCGYQVAKRPGERWGRTILLSSEGSEILRFPQAENLFQDNTPSRFPGEPGIVGGVIAPLTDDDSVLALKYGGGGKSAEQVVVISPEETPRVLLAYPKSPAQTDVQSELMFLDVNGDGTREIVILQLFAVFEDGEPRAKSRMLQYDAIGEPPVFKENERADPELLRRLFYDAEGKPGIKKLLQRGGIVIQNLLGK